MGKVAVIVDGGFIRARLRDKTNNKKADAELIYTEIMAQIKQHFSKDELYRIFYYDSVVADDGKKHPNPVDGKEVSVLDQIDKEYSDILYENLQKKDFIAFRPGELSFTGWVLINPKEAIAKLKNKNSNELEASDFKMNLIQKGVDLKMGMDIAYLAMRKLVDKLAIISGDSDLIPAIKLARREGLHVYLITLGNNVKGQLIQHCDMVY